MPTRPYVIWPLLSPISSPIPLSLLCSSHSGLQLCLEYTRHTPTLGTLYWLSSLPTRLTTRYPNGQPPYFLQVCLSLILIRLTPTSPFKIATFPAPSPFFPITTPCSSILNHPYHIFSLSLSYLSFSPPLPPKLSPSLSFDSYLFIPCWDKLLGGILIGILGDNIIHMPHRQIHTYR